MTSPAELLRDVYERAAQRNKYHAKRTTVDGIRFASAAEAQRYVELRFLERAGEIHGLVLQPKYALDVCGQRIGFAIFDFEYHAESLRVAPRAGMRDAFVKVVEDVKGCDNALSRWKRRHFEAQYGITVQLVKRSRRRAA